MKTAQTNNPKFLPGFNWWQKLISLEIKKMDSLRQSDHKRNEHAMPVNFNLHLSK